MEFGLVQNPTTPQRSYDAMGACHAVSKGSGPLATCPQRATPPRRANCWPVLSQDTRYFRKQNCPRHRNRTVPQHVVACNGTEVHCMVLASIASWCRSNSQRISLRLVFLVTTTSLYHPSRFILPILYWSRFPAYRAALSVRGLSLSQSSVPIRLPSDPAPVHLLSPRKPPVQLAT